MIERYKDRAGASHAVDQANDALHSFFTGAINNYEDGARWRSNGKGGELSDRGSGVNTAQDRVAWGCPEARCAARRSAGEVTIMVRAR